MKIALCEDNPTECTTMRGFIHSYCEKNRFLAEIQEFYSGEALLDAFPSEQFDLVFLDIYMDGITGIDAARKIRETDDRCILIFVTTSSDHALDAYAVDGAAYVQKPLDDERMHHALEKCRERFIKSSRFIRITVAHQSEVSLPLAGIRYVEVYNKDVLFHAASETLKTTRMTLDEAERVLGGAPFLRCHRCFIVNMNYVATLRDRSFQMQNGESVPIRKNGFHEIHRAFNEFILQDNFWSVSL